MNACANLIMSVVSFAVLSASSARGAEPSFSLTISLPQTTIKAGSEVRVKVVLKNTSAREIGLPEEELPGVGQFGFGIEVRDSQGRLAPLTESARVGKLRARPEGSYYMPTVRPGKSLDFEINITRLHDLSRPGKYTIQVHRAHDMEPEILLRSNTMTITVEP